MTRSYKAGLALGKAIIEMVNLMYQKQTASRFYQGLFTALKEEFEKEI